MKRVIVGLLLACTPVAPAWAQSTPESKKAANHRLLQAGTVQSVAPIQATAPTGDFGTRGAHYTVGDWTVAFPSTSSDACIWRDGGAVAVEVIAGSVGWFHLRQGRQECTYYTSHSCSFSDSVFYSRSFEDGVAPSRVGRSMQVTLADPAFETQRSTIYVQPGTIEVKLDDGGRLKFVDGARTFTYTDAEGKTVTLPE